MASVFKFNTWQNNENVAYQNVIQVQTAVAGPARQTISSQSPTLVSGLSLSFTPRFSNSLIFIRAVVNGSFTYVCSLGIFRNGAATVSTSGFTNNNEPNMQDTFYFGTSTTDHIYTKQVLHYETAGSTTARTYAVYCTSGWAGVTYTTYINNRASNDMASFSHMIVMEVSQ